LDCILFYGQRDLFIGEQTELSVYKILKALGLDASHGASYARFRRETHRAFVM
jgi:hypothetical protein